MKLGFTILFLIPLINEGLSCDQIQVSDQATINIKGAKLTLKWLTNDRPDATGVYDGEVIRGIVE